MRVDFGRGAAFWSFTLMALFAGAPAQAVPPIDANGDLSLEFNYQFPPDSSDILRLKEEMNKAQLLLCDATDGRVRLKTGRITIGAEAAERGDVWIYGKFGRAFVDDLGGHAYVYTPVSGSTVAHELGHLLLGVGDSYAEAIMPGSGCGMGPGFDPGTTARDRNNTIMQNHGMCHVKDGPPLYELNPKWNLGCGSDCSGTCSAPGCPPMAPDNDLECSDTPKFASELSVANNFDPLAGTNNSCPAARRATTVDVSAAFDPKDFSKAAQPGQPDDNCGNGVLDAGEECDPNDLVTPRDDCGTMGLAPGKEMGCNENCTFKSTVCSPLPADPCTSTAGKPHACAPGGSGGLGVPPPCSDFGYPAGTASCQFCSANLINCGKPRAAFNPTSWAKAGATSTIRSGWLQAVDGKGDQHLFRFYAQRQSDHQWDLFVLAPAEEYVGGARGNPTAAGKLSLTFDATSHAVASVDGTPGTTGSVTFGGAATGPFVPRSDGTTATALTLTVKLDRVLEDNWQVPQNPMGTKTGKSEFFTLETEVNANTSTDQRPQIASCGNQNLCKQLWHQGNQRYEGTSHRYLQIFAPSYQPYSGGTARSEWEMVAEVLRQRYKMTLNAPETVDPEPKERVDCGGPITWTDPTLPTDPDGVVLVIDRSGSMATPVDSEKIIGPGNREPRMAFAKAASRDFLDLLLDRQSGRTLKVGVVSFSETEQANVQLVKLTSANIDSIKGSVNGLNADGMTAIGKALRKAGDMLTSHDPPLMNKTIVLLSDGANNRPKDGSFNPRTEADELAKKGIVVYTVPTGKAADKNLLGDIAAATKGAMFHAPNGTELPVAFAEIFARAQGETLALERTPIDVAGSIGCAIEGTPCSGGLVPVSTNFGCRCVTPGRENDVEKSVDIKVELGASNLNVLFSVRNDLVNTWNPRFQLVDPAGTVRVSDTGSFVTDGFYRILQMSAPMPGVWKLRLSARDAADQLQFVLAHATNPAPDCFVRVSQTRVPGNKPVAVSVRAYGAGRPLGSTGVTYSGTVTRPDGSKVPLTFSQEAQSNEVSALFDSSNFVGRGVYSVDVQCQVAQDPALALGEGALGPEEGEEGPSGIAEYTRRTSTGFFVDSTTQPPLPPGGDCDQNGTPDSQELQADTDGDGLPDVCDQDDDDDDRHDSADPRPRDPLCSIGPCPTANAGPDQILECTAAGAAPAQLDGSASTNPAGGALTFAWTSTVPLQNASSAIASGTFPVGSTPVTLTVSNGTDGSADLALVAVLDRTPPALGPLQDVTVNACTAPPLTTPQAPDACGGQVTIGNNAPPVFPLGNTVVTWTAVDQYGNVATAPQNVKVMGTGPPTLTIPSDRTITSCENANIGTATATDSCGGQATVTNNAPAKFPLGVTQVTWTATDEAGRTTTKIQLVTAELGDNENCCPAGTNKIKGTANGENLTGTPGSDCILGLGGNDQLFGQGGNDYLSGGEGNDNLYGDAGNDRLYGGNGIDGLYAGDGADFCSGGLMDDVVNGQGGNDTLEGGSGNDNMAGGDGDDVVKGGVGNDILSGDAGSDQLFGEDGDDQLNGGLDNDTLNGGPGTDSCTSGGGTDTKISC